jgi:hypothetical protein
MPSKSGIFKPPPLALRGSFPPKMSKTESPFLLGRVGKVVASSHTPQVEFEPSIAGDHGARCYVSI